MKIKKVMVVGAGNMGHQIAIQSALSGFDVFCFDTNPEMLDGADSFFNDWLKSRVEKQRLTQEEADKTRESLIFTPDMISAADNADIVIEAVPDVLDIKRKVLAEIDQCTPERTIFGSNSSYLVSSKFADAVKDPSKVINIHFFNPALVMKVVEVVKGPHVSDGTFESARSFVEAIGKTAVTINKEAYGFLVNRIVTAITTEAGYIVDQEIATPQDVDIAVKGALNHPMGPFELLDLAGLDLEYSIRMERFKDTGDRADRPAAALISHVARGEYGRKTKKGFYAYD